MHPFTIDPQKPLRAAVLGCTGSVGTQALEVLSHLGCRIVLLSAGSNAEAAAQIARHYRPEICTMQSEAAAQDVRLLLAGEDVRVLGGSDAVCEAIREAHADLIIHAISGLAGLSAALAAAQTGARIGMANKEAIIAAGDTIYDALRSSGGELIPVDSEHSAIFQCLMAAGAASPERCGDPSLVRRILLTASGGPFFGRKREEIALVTPAQALAHPTWKMGAKITVDCATLMNKGFEIIEAVRLFAVPEERIEVLVHRQSIIHSMVEYIDHSVVAQLGVPDMRACIRFAVSCPSRAWDDGEGLDFTRLGSLSFSAPDTDTFVLLNAARAAIRRGGIAPAALIAADEEAVAAFLTEKISFGAIADTVCETMARIQNAPADSVRAILEAEEAARQTARSILKGTSH